MKLFARQVYGGIQINAYQIEVKNEQIWFGKIGFAFLSEPLLTSSSPSILIALYYYLYAKPAYKRRIKKLTKLQKAEDFLKNRGNFILNICDIERIHYNSPVQLDIYFILKNGKEYNFFAQLDDLEIFNELFKGVPITTKDYLW